MQTSSRTRTTEDDRLLVLSFYAVVDVSYSMQQSGAIDAANEILPKVADAVGTNPTLGDVVRFGALDFSDDARVVLRLGDLRDVTTLPAFTVRGGTSYAAAFRLLRQEIERDVAQLRLDNFRTYRPAVFFITDGLPMDEPAELQEAFGALTDRAFRARPNIIPFGVGEATKDGLAPWVYPKAGDSQKPMRSYIAKEGVEPATAINRAAEILISSVIASANSVNTAGESGGFVLPADEDLDDDWLD